MNKARVIAELKAMFDEKTAVFNDVDMAKYIDDLMGVVSLPPLGVILPQSTEQVVQLIKFCNANDVYTIPQGGLTGLASAAVPIGVERSVIVSMEKMNQIHTLDVFDNSMVVDSGVILAQVQNAAKDVGRYFPLSHGGEGSSQIGGNIATNSGGNNALKYGTARDQVLGLEVVMGNGEIYSNLKGLRKNTAGLDLKHLFIGSQGKFGIITKAALKLRPYPNNRATALVGVNSPEVALKLLRDLELYLGENISAFELISDMAMNYALKVENTRFALTEKAAWYVLIEAETAAKDLPLDEAMEKA